MLISAKSGKGYPVYIFTIIVVWIPKSLEGDPDIFGEASGRLAVALSGPSRVSCKQFPFFIMSHGPASTKRY